MRAFFSRMRRVLVRSVALSVLAGCASVACAADIHISAEFKPDLHDPDQREFTNTTPWSGVCAGGHLQTCIRNNWWSIDMRIRGTKQGDGVRNWGRGSLFMLMPGPRTVMITAEDGSSSHTLDLNILGAAIRVTDKEMDGGPNPASLGGPSSGCMLGLTNGSAGNYSAMRMFLRNSGGQGVSSCSLHWLEANNFEIEQLDLVYRLTTPRPLAMRSGVYRGSTTYTVGGTGEGADFDLGDGVTLDDRSVTLHFTLEVRHAFRLDLPAGHGVAVLAPRGGWRPWIDHGVAPKALEQEIPFALSSSGQFAVSMACQYPLPDGRCALRELAERASDVPVDVTLTLPGFHHLETGAEAVEVPLSSTGPRPLFSAGSVVIGRPSRLRFAVNGDAVRSMLDHPGSRYRGDVTVVFDADP